MTRSPRSAPGIAYTLVHREPWIVVLASGRPLAGAEQPPTLAALAEWPFASLGSHDASPAFAAYRRAAAAHGVTPRLGPVATAIDDLLALVAAGQTWTLLTAPNAGALADGLVALGAPAALGQAEMWLAHRARPAPLERALLTLATEHAAPSPTPGQAALSSASDAAS